MRIASPTVTALIINRASTYGGIIRGLGFRVLGSRVWGLGLRNFKKSL